MKIIDFIKNNKVPTIAASVVLVAAIAVGIAFGVVNHKDKIETTKPFGGESSSAGSSSTISVPPIEGNSSTESTSSEESTSSASETIETNSTPSKAESVSPAQGSSKPTTTTTKPASSTPSVSNPSTGNNNGGSTGGNTGSSAPSTGGNTGTSTPSTGGNTGTSTKWVCPDPSAHPQESAADCIVEYDHKSFVAQYQEQEANKDKIPTRNPEDVGKICWICGRPYGDGYNGTCLNYFCDGSYKCHHYDTGETCQIKHKG